MFSDKLMLTTLIILFGLLLIMVAFPTKDVKADADEVIEVTTVLHFKVGDENHTYEYCSSARFVTEEPVVGNGTGHYYNYHIMNAPGHEAHSSTVVRRVRFDLDYFVPDCHGYKPEE